MSAFTSTSLSILNADHCSHVKNPVVSHHHVAPIAVARIGYSDFYYLAAVRTFADFYALRGWLLGKAAQQHIRQVAHVRVVVRHTFHGFLPTPP
jgi:hypothetical protein